MEHTTCWSGTTFTRSMPMNMRQASETRCSRESTVMSDEKV